MFLKVKSNINRMLNDTFLLFGTVTAKNLPNHLGTGDRKTNTGSKRRILNTVDHRAGEDPVARAQVGDDRHDHQ